MPFYEYSQNNSGGDFVEEMGHGVFIEIATVEEANDRAEGMGIYFNGVDSGSDCPCCGDRWSTAWNEAASTREELIKEVRVSIEYAQYWGLPVLVLFAGESEPVRVVGVSDMALLEG